MLSESHFITISAYEKKVTNIPDSLKPAKNVRIVAPVIQEIDNDKVIWQWDGSKYVEFYTTCAVQNHFNNASISHNYMHINSIIIDPIDSNLIISCRNANQVLKLNRKNGEIIWRLGGKNSDFPLSKDQYFLTQHNVQLIDSNKTYLMFDNGYFGIRESSRILEFQLDEINKKVTGFKAYTIPKPFSSYMGSVEKIGDNYFICGGSTPFLLEVNSKTGEILMDMQGNQAMYRATIVDTIPNSIEVLH